MYKYIHIRTRNLEEDSKYKSLPDLTEKLQRNRNKMQSLMTEETVAKFYDGKAYAKKEKEGFVSHDWPDSKSSGTDSFLSSVTAERSSFSILFTAIHR